MNNQFGAFGQNIQGVIQPNLWTGAWTPTPLLLQNAAGQLNLLKLDRLTQATLTVGRLGAGTLTPGATVDAVGTVRAQGQDTPATGAGIEVYYGAPNGVIQCYDHGVPAFKNLDIEGLTLQFNTSTNGAISTGTGLFTHAGDVTIAPAAAFVHLNLNGASGQQEEIHYQKAGVNRWIVYVDNATESGSNVGSDWAIGRYTDAGGFVDQPIKITRSTGLITAKKFVTYNGDTTAGNGLASNVANVTLTGKTAAIGSTTTGFTPPVDGEYLVTFTLALTTIGTGGSIQGNIIYTDEIGSVTLAGPSISAGGVTGRQGIVMTMHAKTTASINYSVVFNSVTGNPIYDIFINVMRLS